METRTTRTTPAARPIPAVHPAMLGIVVLLASMASLIWFEPNWRG